MAANMLIFKSAAMYRDALIKQQQRDIAGLYTQWSKSLGDKVRAYGRKTTNSAPVQAEQLRILQRAITETGTHVTNDIANMITGNIYKVADSVVSANKEWLKSIGFANSNVISGAFGYVPKDIVAKLVTGQIYENGWNLSQRIWSANQQNMQQAYEVVAGGLAQNKPMYEIAKDLEKYVSPGARKPWNLVSADGKKIYPREVDYNAQRLGRTLAQHGYQQSFVETTRSNPFITDYVWRSNGSRVCELCMERDGAHFSKDNLPLDHPNGMCTMEPNVVDDLNDQLANWFNADEGTYPEIDSFAAALRG